MTLNDLEPRNGRYSALFYGIRQIRGVNVNVVEVITIMSDKNVAPKISFSAIYLMTGLPLIFPEN